MGVPLYLTIKYTSSAEVFVLSNTAPSAVLIGNNIVPPTLLAPEPLFPYKSIFDPNGFVPAVLESVGVTPACIKFCVKLDMSYNLQLAYTLVSALSIHPTYKIPQLDCLSL